MTIKSFPLYIICMTTKEYIEIYDRCPNEYNPYEGSEKDLEDMRSFNKELIRKYPWIEPRNNWSGKKISVCAGPDGEEGFWPGDPKLHPEYNYEYTVLDDMPEGWRIAFGDQMCEEIDQELRRFDYQDKYEITEIKEKYGSLRWYDNGTPYKLSDEPAKEFEIHGFDVLERNWDPNKYVLRSLWSDHYINPFDNNVDMTREEIDKYNKDAIHHYALYEIIDECRVQDIIDKYTELSRNICINCGKPAEWMSKGWISPYCTDCAKEMMKGSEYNLRDSFTPID